MRRTSRVVVLTGLMLSILAIPGFASTVAPPRNIGALAKVSKAVVFAEVVREWNEVHGTVPYTVTAFRTVQEVKGQVRGTFEVQEQGGIAGTVGVTVLGAAKFEKGGRYLLFLEPAADGQRWQTKMLSYGILREDKETGTLRPLSQAADLQIVERPGVEAIGTYREKELLQLLGAVASGASPWYREAVEIKPLDLGLEKTTELGVAGAALKAAPAACQFVTSPDGYPTRWTTFETGGSLGVWHTTPGQVGIADGGVSAVQEAAAAWKNPVSSVVNINYAGSKARSATCSGNTAFAPNNEVVFNDPCNDVPELAATCEDGSTTPPGWTSPCCGQVARFLTYSDMSQFNNHDGETWRPILGMSVVVNNGAQCVGETDFKEVITHFVGHGVGFGHHNDPEATMYGQLGVHPSRGAALGQTDLICAEADYHTFLDVPYSTASFWNYIEAIENAGITLGCGVGYLLPEQPDPARGDGGLPGPRQARRRLRAAAGHRHGVHRRPRRLLGGGAHRAALPRRDHQGVLPEPAALLHHGHRDPGRDGDLPDPRQVRRRLRAAGRAGGLPGRAAQLLGVGVDRADVPRRRDQRLLGHRAAVLPGGQGDPLADGEVPGGGVQPAAAAVSPRAPSGPRSGC